MDVFTSNESGRDNFLMDLFVVLVIASFVNHLFRDIYDDIKRNSLRYRLKI
jgi:hypothetical protein